MSDVGRYRSNWQDEIDSAALYRSLAEAERQSRLSEIYLKLADAEERRSAFLAEKLRAAGVAVPPACPAWRSRWLGALAKRFGAAFVLPTVLAAERAHSRGAGVLGRSEDD